MKHGALLLLIIPFAIVQFIAMVIWSLAAGLTNRKARGYADLTAREFDMDREHVTLPTSVLRRSINDPDI